MLLGIVSGLAAALFQDCGYIASRIYVKRIAGAVDLLRRSQLMMAAAGIVFFPFLDWSAIWRHPKFITPMLLCALGSLLGQVFFFQAEKEIEPSRLSSLMSLRVVLLAAICFVVDNEHYGTGQIAGIILAPCGAFLINWRGNGFSWKGMQWMAASLAAYCISDVSVRHMIHALNMQNRLLASLLAVVVVNLTIAMLILPFSRKDWSVQRLAPAAPYSGFWLLKQILLYLCYVSIGPVHGNVVLSLRGPLAILLTLIAVKKTHIRDIDDTVDLKAWLIRGAATLLMTVAVILYSW